jgi:hypothetical protein
MPLARTVSRARDCQRSMSMLVGCPPNEAVITAIGILDTYRLARSWGVRLRRRRNRPATWQPDSSFVRPWNVETRCVKTKAMIFSCRKPDRLPRAITPAREPANAQTADGRPRPVRDEKYFEYEQGLSLGLMSLHLLTASAHLGAQRCAHRRGLLVRPRRVAGHTPHSSELRHCTAYPAEPEATWAQPVTREELWPISAQRPHLARCSPVHAGTETKCPSNASPEFPHVGLITQNSKDD